MPSSSEIYAAAWGARRCPTSGPWRTTRSTTTEPGTGCTCTSLSAGTSPAASSSRRGKDAGSCTSSSWATCGRIRQDRGGPDRCSLPVQVHRENLRSRATPRPAPVRRGSGPSADPRTPDRAQCRRGAWQSHREDDITPVGGLVILDRGEVARATLGVGVMARLDDDTVRTWVTRSCHAQGLPVTVTDPRIVEQVRVLLTGQAKMGSESRTGRGTAERARQRERQPDQPSTTRPGTLTVGGQRHERGAA